MKETIRILVVDDEDSIRRRCVRLLSREGYHVVGVAHSNAALDMIMEEQNRFDILLVDIRMRGMDGIQLLEKVKAFDASVEVIMMTAYAAVDTAVKAMKMGAYDYLPKPFDIDELIHVVRNVVEKKLLQQEVLDLRRQLKDKEDRPLLLGSSAAMSHVNRFIHKVAPVDCNILLCGESGTGKELVAKAIHGGSFRQNGPFVVADCAALSGSLLESELFGHLKGAFTGAHASRKGYFESAHRGTIFLDEVSELPLELQGKLLRAVQEQTIIKVGDTRPVEVDTRIISATNRNLEERVTKRAFREDLFYRLNVVSITIPPLRERREDIPLLVKHFLRRQAALLGLSEIPRISSGTLDMMTWYDWPGNVRELENAVHRAVVLAENGELDVKNLLPNPTNGPVYSTHLLKTGVCFQDLRREVVRDFTRCYLDRVLRHHKGNITRAAQTMGMRRTSLQRLLKQWGVDGRKYRAQDASEGEAGL